MIWTAISSIIPWEWIAGAVAVVGGLGLAWWRGRRSGAVARDLKAARGYINTRNATDEVDMGNDAGLVRDGLSKRDPNKR